jgi:hypothetical protein
MRTTLALFATALILGAIQLWSPFAGRELDGNALDLVVGFAGLVVFFIATAYGALHGPSARSISLLMWSILSFLFSIAFMTIGGYVPDGERGISINTIAFAVSAGLFVLAIEEGIRGYLESRGGTSTAEVP